MTIWRPAISLAVGAAGAVLAALVGDWRYALSIGCDASGITFCAWTWLAIWPLSAEQTAALATREDRAGPSGTSSCSAPPRAASARSAS